MGLLALDKLNMDKDHILNIAKFLIIFILLGLNALLAVQLSDLKFSVNSMQDKFLDCRHNVMIVDVAGVDK